MKKGVIIGIIIAIIILGTGYLFFFTNLFKNCPGSCDDFNECTEDFCSEQTDFSCVHRPIDDCCGNNKCETGETYQNCADDCINCDDFNECTADSYDYHLQECVNRKISPCCGNGICESIETHNSCSKDCIFGDGEYIELGVSFLNNPSHFTGTGLRYFYSIENCLSDEIENLELTSYYDGVKEKPLTKEWLLSWPAGSAESDFLKIPSSTCNNRISLIFESSNNKELGKSYAVKVYYKFNYKDKTFEFMSDEANVIVLDKEPMKGHEKFAVFIVDNSNIKII